MAWTHLPSGVTLHQPRLRQIYWFLNDTDLDINPHPWNPMKSTFTSFNPFKILWNPDLYHWKSWSKHWFILDPQEDPHDYCHFYLFILFVRASEFLINRIAQSYRYRHIWCWNPQENHHLSGLINSTSLISVTGIMLSGKKKKLTAGGRTFQVSKLWDFTQIWKYGDPNMGIISLLGYFSLQVDPRISSPHIGYYYYYYSILSIFLMIFPYYDETDMAQNWLARELECSDL